MGSYTFLCKRVTTQLKIIFTFFLFLFLFPISILLCIPIYLFRFLVTMARKMFRQDLGKLVSTRSVALALDRPDNDPQWTLCVWITFEGNFDFEEFRGNFLKKIILKRSPTGDLLHPEYQQYFHEWIGFLFWKWEKDFDVMEHMRYFYQDTLENFKEKVTNEEELRQIIKDLTVKSFGKKKSPWEFLYLPNYLENKDEKEPNKSVLIFRVHHGLCDGFAILWLLLVEVNANKGWEDVAKPIKVQKRKTLMIRIFEGLCFWLKAPYEFSEVLVKSLDKNEWHLPKKQLERPFNTNFTDKIPLSYIKEIKNGHNVSFTTVIMSAITGALRKEMIERGVKIPEKLTTAFAIPMPGHPKKLRNHFSMSFMALPVGISDPVLRLRKMEETYQKLRRSPASIIGFYLAPLLGGLFTCMMDRITYNRFSTVIISNFPGPPETAYFEGENRQKVLDMNFSAGMGVGNVGIGFCMMSYIDGMKIISSAAPSIMPSDASVEELNSKIMQEFEILKNLSLSQA